MMGAGILIASVAIIIVYIYWLFGTPVEWTWFGMSVRWYAVAIPVFIAVLAVLGIAGWIGYTMATTPPPKPLEELPELSETEKKEPSKSETSETKQ